MTRQLTRHNLGELDRRDPLGPCRQLFHLPDGLLYFDGNSLGPPPLSVHSHLADVAARQWGQGLVSSWNDHGWIDLPRRVAAKVAPLVGAGSDEVAVGDSTSVNLFKLLAAALALRPGRRTVLSEDGQFPTDLYMAQGLGELIGGVKQRLVAVEDVAGAIDGDVAVVALSHVRFKSGRLLDMAALTRAAHDAGALVLWDLSHSAGALPVDLGGCGADLAVGCGYKFLNGGPGAPAFLYVARRHQEAARSPLQGWMGHADPFAFDLAYRPASGVGRFLCGTPPILSLAALDAALDVFDGVGMDVLRRKSLELGDLLIELVLGACGGFGVGLLSPRDGAQRGSQVSFTHPEGYAVVQALIDRGVVPDFRQPDVMRFALTPLYHRYADVWDAVEVLRDVLVTGAWDEPRYRERKKVT